MKCDPLHEKMGPKSRAGWGVDQNMAKTPQKSENLKSKDLLVINLSENQYLKFDN